MMVKSDDDRTGDALAEAFTEIHALRAARDAAVAEAARARADCDNLRAIRDAVMECPDDQRRELYRADLIAGKALVEAERLRADRDRLAAALGRVEALCDLREPHGRRPNSWVYIADLRRALSDAPTTEGPTT